MEDGEQRGMEVSEVGNNRDDSWNACLHASGFGSGLRGRLLDNA